MKDAGKVRHKANETLLVNASGYRTVEQKINNTKTTV
jgi:hypothetical protein